MPIGHIVTAQNHTTNQVALLRVSLYKGAYSRVAKKLGMSRSYVRRVGVDKAHNPRVLAALIADSRRIERLIEKEVGENAA